jgi:hypothetical protein
MSTGGPANGRTFVVIGGLARSGTQLTRRVIGSHSAIAITNKEFKVKEVLEGRTDMAGFFDRLPIDDWGIEWRDLVDLPLGTVYRELLIRCADAVGKPIGGEKSPGNEDCLDAMRQWFAADRLVVIHLIRNPVDRLASLTEAPFRANYEVNVDPDKQARIWVRSVEAALERSSAAPEDYVMVRYEDLTADPEPVTRRIFAAIGVPYEPEALTLHAYQVRDNTSFPDAGADGGTPVIRQQPSRSWVLEPDAIEVVRRIAGPTASSIGYDLGV